ncbi:MAG: hypothetical protein ACQERX_03290 [Bacillota bacterium]
METILSIIYDEINLNKDYIINGLYLDSQLTTELTSFQVNGDMDIYVSVNELQLLNITVIYDNVKFQVSLVIL